MNALRRPPLGGEARAASLRYLEDRSARCLPLGRGVLYRPHLSWEAKMNLLWPRRGCPGRTPAVPEPGTCWT